MVLPYSIMKKYHSQNHIEGNTVPVHMQNLIATFISSGGFERHLNKMRRIYRRKLTYILKRLKPYKEQLVCSPNHKGHDDLTSSPPSSGLSPAVNLECPT